MYFPLIIQIISYFFKIMYFYSTLGVQGYRTFWIIYKLSLEILPQYENRSSYIVFLFQFETSFHKKAVNTQDNAINELPH